MSRATITAVPVHEIRDYHLVNAEVVRLLDRGAPHLRLASVEGQRLLLAGLRGAWNATVEIQGDAGPELAAGLEAPGLTVVVRGSTADGAGRSLAAGSILIFGTTGDAVAYGQRGGLVCVLGPAGHRAGLGLEGGLLWLRGGAGRLAGHRQAGGLIVAAGAVGPFAGHGRRGGSLATHGHPMTPEDAARVQDAAERLRPWLDPEAGRD
jgi:glutamate synthase domain-containing protein 3